MAKRREPPALIHPISLGSLVAFFSLPRAGPTDPRTFFLPQAGERKANTHLTCTRQSEGRGQTQPNHREPDDPMKKSRGNHKGSPPYMIAPLSAFSTNLTYRRGKITHRSTKPRRSSQSPPPLSSWPHTRTDNEPHLTCRREVATELGEERTHHRQTIQEMTVSTSCVT